MGKLYPTAIRFAWFKETLALPLCFVVIQIQSLYVNKIIEFFVQFVRLLRLSAT